MQSEAGIANRQWSEQFGDVYRFQSCFGVRDCFQSVIRVELRLVKGGVVDAERSQGHGTRVAGPDYDVPLGRESTRVSSNGNRSVDHVCHVCTALSLLVSGKGIIYADGKTTHSSYDSVRR